MMLHDVFFGLALAVFGSAGATAIGVIAATIAPQWPRICRLARGHVEPASAASVLARRSLQDRGLAPRIVTSARIGS